jgi:hypothetical protein
VASVFLRRGVTVFFAAGFAAAAASIAFFGITNPFFEETLP